MQKSDKSMQRSFYKLFLTMTLVLIIPLSLICVGYAYAMQAIVLQDYVSLNGQIIDNVSTTINTSITSQINFAYSLTNVSSLKKLSADLTEDVPDKQDASQELRHFMRSILFNNLASMAAIYFPNLDLVISSESTNTTLAQFYDRYIGYADMDAGDFRNWILAVETHRYSKSRPTTPSASPNRSIMLYAQPINLGYLRPRAYFLTVIDTSILSGLVLDSFSGEVRFQLFDMGGAELVRSLGMTDAWAEAQAAGVQGKVVRTEAGARFRIFTPRALSCGLRFVFYVPESTVMRQIDRFIFICLVTAFACLFIGLVIANAIARRLHNPYEKLLVAAFPDGLSAGMRSMGEGFDLVAARMRETRLMNQHFQEELKAYFASSQDNMLLFLLTRSAYLSKEELEEAAAICELPLRYCAYQAAVLKAAHPDAEPPQFPNAFPQDVQVMTARLSSLQYVVVAAFPQMDAESPLPRMLEAMRANFHIGISQVHSSIDDLARCLTEADTACHRQVQEGYLTAEAQDVKDIPSYPLDQEMRIIAAARDGHYAQVSQLLNAIREENSIERSGNPEAMARLFERMAITALRICEQLLEAQRLPLESGMERMARLGLLSLSPEQAFGEILAFYRQLCNAVSSDIHVKNQSIFENVRAYLNANYADQTLCLDQVAEHLGVSYYFLSRIFKSETNQSFTDMLNDTRIYRAMSLLRSTTLAVQEISAQVGYTNWSTFLRAFRKRTGTTPLQYRNAGGAEKAPGWDERQDTTNRVDPIDPCR